MNLEDMNPAEMLNAVMNDELSLDGDVKESEQQEPEAKDEQTKDEPEAKVEDAEEPEGAPIASKSGGYTIPYEKLAEARDRAKTYEAENEQLKAMLQEMTLRQQVNMEQAQAAMADGQDPSIFGDFSEEDLSHHRPYRP